MKARIKNYNPKEEEEYPIIAQRLDALADLYGFLYTHTAQSTYVGLNISIAKKLNRNGVRRGLPDFIIVLPVTWTGFATPVVLFAEIKRREATVSSVKPEQKHWIKNLNKIPNVEAGVFYGADDLLDYIDTLKKH